MTLPLHPDMLASAYDYLRTTPPFRGWRLPDSDDVIFKVANSNTHFGWYDRKKGQHTLAVSRKAVGHTVTLMASMAHEAIHLHQAIAGLETPGTQHNANFKKLAKQVCKYHGFDPNEF